VWQADREKEAAERKEKRLDKLRFEIFTSEGNISTGTFWLKLQSEYQNIFLFRKLADGGNKGRHEFSDPVYDKVTSSVPDP
jgi:hypothetical protein